MHYYKFNIKDWTRDTAHLSVIEEGVYRRLLDHYYESEKPIPKETAVVIRKLRLAGHEDSLSVILGEFFADQDDGYHHFRCDDEISKYHAKAGANKVNGKLGGRPRKPTNNPDGFDNEPTDNLNHKPLTINQEPIESKELANDESLTSDAKPTRKVDPVPYDVIIESYRKCLPDLPQPEEMTPKRKAGARSIWKQYKKSHEPDFWDRYFTYVGKQEFLCNMKGIGINWLLNFENMCKVIEGNYE
jgi:uncharacterized protein YdaU (DUF1376 family)